MFDYIKGTYIGLNKEYIVVENNNIGYKIYTSGSTMAKMPNINEEVKIYIEQIVREDFLGLYGFLTEEEREMFNLLMTINGVGRRAALSLLSIASISKLKLAILSGDFKTFIKAPGVGKKIAQRIVLELKDKISKVGEDDIDLENIIDTAQDINRNHDDALEALIALGFTEKESESALKTVDTNGSLEEIIKSSLKYLMN
ncbi:MAG: Holliday junction branch migration protein RuvA [Clostridium sp.]|nr:Holliday junction branch migration protein RuvA [Clostridium sp.]